MRVPTQVRIGGIIYSVERPAVVDDQDMNTIGQLDEEKCIIKIKAELHGDKAGETLLHEIIHGVDIFMDAGLTETQVARLANGLHAVLRENGLLNLGGDSIAPG